MYFYCEKESNNLYTIRMKGAFYKVLGRCECGSYYNIIPRLFDLLPQDYYHYVAATYNAKLIKSVYFSAIYIYFSTLEDAKALCSELNRRFEICVSRGDFV